MPRPPEMIVLVLNPGKPNTLPEDRTLLRRGPLSRMMPLEIEKAPKFVEKKELGIVIERVDIREKGKVETLVRETNSFDLHEEVQQPEDINYIPFVLMTATYQATEELVKGVEAIILLSNAIENNTNFYLSSI